MKKVIALMFTLALCATLCACGAISAGAGSEVSVTLPTKPAQIAVPTRPVTEDVQSSESAEKAESTEPTEETWPWEAEFIEENYDVYHYESEDCAQIIEWAYPGTSRPPLAARSYYEYLNGDIEVTYFYPPRDGGVLPSHSYWYGADGSYAENHYLDNGHITVDENGYANVVWGSMIYRKTVQPDGSYVTREYNVDGISIYSVTAGADGSYEERRYFENGYLKSSICNDPSTGDYNEQEYYENGNCKHLKTQTAEYTSEEHFDEEAYRTYYYYKDANLEIELTADETGKLIKAVENGAVMEDAASLAQFVQGYNFRE